MPPVVHGEVLRRHLGAELGVCPQPGVELRHDGLGGCQLGDQVAVEQQLLAVAATPELIPKS